MNLVHTVVPDKFPSKIHNPLLLVGDMMHLEYAHIINSGTIPVWLLFDTKISSKQGPI